jgi:aryl-alcohol dehydrogenase-like predicted oxidoreductase
LGRVGRGASLRAMGTAWDEGITLFDTARSYGFGEAEAVLGEFLRGKREQAIVATKFGILPQRQSALKRVAVSVARAAMQVPGVRGLKRSRGSHEVTYGQFSVAGLRESLETSLRELRTDRVDVLFLHEATAAAMRQQELMAELDALVEAGKVLRVGLYAGANVVAEGMTNGPATLSAMQFGGNYFDPVVAGFGQKNSRGMFLIANHPFGGEQRVARTKAVLAAMSTDETVPAELRDKVRGADWQAVLEAILGVVLGGTGTHVLVFSMMDQEHLRANVRAIEKSRFNSAELVLIRRRLLGSSSIIAGA